ILREMIGTDARRPNHNCQNDGPAKRPAAQTMGTESARSATGTTDDTAMSVLWKILVPRDYSLDAREAFRVAYDLAKPTGASVTEDVVRRADCAVIVIMARARRAGAPLIRRPIGPRRGPSHD